MSRADAWSTSTWPLASWLDDHDQAVDMALIISDKPTSIVAVRNGAAQSAQTVRIENYQSAREVKISTGDVFTIDAIVFGYKGHPTIADTNLKPADRFAVAGGLYEILMILPGLTDSFQAYARVIS